jgi:hypothetical protein
MGSPAQPPEQIPLKRHPVEREDLRPYKEVEREI